MPRKNSRSYERRKEKRDRALLILIVVIIILGVGLTSVILWSSGFFPLEGNVALIKIIGDIGSEESILASGVSSSEIVEELEKAAEDPSIKAIVLEINSPGGSVVAVNEISRKLAEINKPKVAWIREMGTSGAYWIATFCDKIIADEFSMTGSIGVTASYLEFSGFLQRYNISYVRLVSGEKKDMGSPFKKPTEEELEIFKEMIKEVYDRFVEIVAKNRGLNESFVRNISDGSIFSGRKALELKLVDELGGEKEVKEAVKELTGLKEVKFKEFGKKINILELLSLFGRSQFLPIEKIRITV